MSPEAKDTMWRFLRGDLSTADFEAWFYQHEAELLEPLGEALHFDLLSMNFADDQALDAVRIRLRHLMRPALTCECPTLKDEDVIPVGGTDGLDQRFFATVDKVRAPGKYVSWVWLGKCRACEQYWVIAQESDHYDVHFIDRITSETVVSIVVNNHWPEPYQTYEGLIKLGRLRRHLF